MLSSTAKNLYWMGRYLQRAKSTARLIEATQRMALQSRGEEAAGVAAIFGMEDEFRQTQQQSSGRLASLIDFLVIDENNPSSIVSSIGAARRNAREERNNITVDVWESLNGLWLELSERLRGNRALLDRGALIESVKKQAVMIFGAAQVDAAARRGLQLPAARRLPRARRQHRAHPRRQVPCAAARRQPACRRSSTTSPGRRCWPASARCAPTGASIAARSIPMKVAELMMLRRDVPRSVHHCLWMVDLSMRELAEAYGTRGEADRLAGELHARLRYARIDQVFEIGLNKFLGGVRDDIATLSDEIGRQFLLD